jgi:hypothetical protein
MKTKLAIVLLMCNTQTLHPLFPRLRHTSMHNAKEKAALSNYSCASDPGKYTKLFPGK